MNWSGRIGSRNSIFIAVCGIAIVLGICYFTGILPSMPDYDAEITAMGVCLHNSTFSPVASIANDINQFYLCGVVEGTTNLSGTLYLFFGETVIYQDGVTVNPGEFFLQISTTELDSFHSGLYRAEINYAKQLLAEVTFEVIDESAN